MKRNKLRSRMTPPGIPLRREISFLLFGYLLALLFSFQYLARYVEARQDLFEWVAGRRVLREGAVIADFPILMRQATFGFFAVACALLGLAVFHYIYYRQGSMSIYLMKRLPRRAERHVRALAFPLSAVVLTGAAAFLLRFLYFVLYLCATPKGCLPAQVWQQFWRFF